MSRELTPRRSIAEIAKQAVKPGIYHGKLAEEYDGIGQYVLVSLAQSSVASAYKARVAAGDFGTGERFPIGTPVTIAVYRGKIEILSLGNKLRSALYTRVNAQTAISVDTSWKALRITGSSAPAGWNLVGFDDSAWGNAVIYPADANFPLDMGDVDHTAIPGDEIILRREYYIDSADLSGGPVVFKYALDNAGDIYINGTKVVDLGPDFTNTNSNWHSDHATTISRGYFEAGLNCIAIYANNETAGSVGNTPPGAVGGGVYIGIPVDGATIEGGPSSSTGGESSPTGHLHTHNELLGRFGTQHHAASGITETIDGDVQTAIDNLRSSASGADAVDLARRGFHGIFIATYHKNSDNYPYLLASLDGLEWEEIGAIRPDSVRDPSLIHWDGAYWMVGTYGAVTSFGLFKKTDLFDGTDWTLVANVPVDGSATNIWAPEWVRNMDGTPYLHPSTGYPVVTVSRSAAGSGGPFTIRELHATNRAMTAWSASVDFVVNGAPSTLIDGYLLVDGDTRYLWFKDESAKHIEIAVSTAAILNEGFNMFEQGDWAGWNANKAAGANSIEGPCVVRLEDGRWRIYFNENNGYNSIRAVYSETTDDWRTGTSTWTTNASITTTELMSHGTVVYLPGIYDHMRDPNAHERLFASIVTDHGELVGLGDDDHTQYLNSARHALEDHSVFLSQVLYEPLTSGTSPAFEPVYTADGRMIMVPVED